MNTHQAWATPAVQVGGVPCVARHLLTIFACTISGGLLTLPSVFADVALAPALLLVLLSAATTVCSLVGLVQCAALDASVRGYSSLLAGGSASAARCMQLAATRS